MERFFRLQRIHAQMRVNHLKRVDIVPVRAGEAAANRLTNRDTRRETALLRLAVDEYGDIIAMVIAMNREEVVSLLDHNALTTFETHVGETLEVTPQVIVLAYASEMFQLCTEEFRMGPVRRRGHRCIVQSEAYRLTQHGVFADIAFRCDAENFAAANKNDVVVADGHIHIPVDLEQHLIAVRDLADFAQLTPINGTGFDGTTGAVYRNTYMFGWHC
ncbi:hypothetical protein X636_10625 [Pandoraea pnomenusa]|nr:hypothetical protein X636_10625 [Pandoraea pnomenusa]